MIRAFEYLSGTTVTGRLKCPKSRCLLVTSELNKIDGISVDEVTTDEFDIPPSSILKVTVDLESLTEDGDK